MGVLPIMDGHRVLDPFLLTWIICSSSPETAKRLRLKKQRMADLDLAS